MATHFMKRQVNGGDVLFVIAIITIVAIASYPAIELTRVILHWKEVFPIAPASLGFDFPMELTLIWIGYAGIVILVLSLLNMLFNRREK